MNDDCIFCKIANKEIAAEILKDTYHAILLKDKNPKAPHHVLAISKSHSTHLGEVMFAEDILGTLALLCEYAYENKLDKSGFRIVANAGADAGQTVNHYHVHLLGGAKLKDDFGA
jgi:histidine triad (HIT) family protein